MAKRARGSVRPGQRRPIDRRPTTSPAAAPKPVGLSEAELARAEEIERQLLAEERAAETARRRTVERSATREVAGTRTLAFEEEYAYVSRDLKDIGRIALLLFVVLFALYIVIDVMDVVKIG